MCDSSLRDPTATARCRLSSWIKQVGLIDVFSVRNIWYCPDLFAADVECGMLSKIRCTFWFFRAQAMIADSEYSATLGIQFCTSTIELYEMAPSSWNSSNLRGFWVETHTLMKPQTSAETKYLSRSDLSEVSTRIKLLWARLMTSFFERYFVDIVIKLPEWQPATRMSFLALVATIQVIVSVLIESSTLSS